MRVLVTGGVGFVGGAAARGLLADGLDVVAVVRPGTDDRRIAALPDGIAVAAADLAEPEAIAGVVAATRPDVVVHAAASPGHPSTAADRLAAWRNDVLGTAALLEALRDAAPDRLVHVCSSLVYRPSPQPLGEDAALGPETVRGAVKLAAAVAVQQWSTETAVPAVIVRPFSVYGPGERPGRVVPTLLRAIADGTPFAITAEEQRRDFVHVDDVARCIGLAVTSPAADGRVLNVGTGVETSPAELVAAAEAVTGKEVIVAAAPYPPTPPRRPHWVADPSVAAALLGWRATITLADGLHSLWWSR